MPLGLSAGQWLSVPMVAVGGFLMVWLSRRPA
jgi:prolipoprotein diacylglyceryltransferase